MTAAGVLALGGLFAPPAAGAALAGPAAGSQVPAPTPGRLLLSWSFNPLVTVGLLALAIAYLQARKRLVANGVAWPARRTAYFLCGVGAIAVALLSPIEAYDTVL
ncbi:MAG TPA: cytochrome c oxidase assembly protein, partial [Actinomycetes bacterium]|nr:cytochrome c oxidase assembly protein [Actinomycetes bacterium]